MIKKKIYICGLGQIAYSHLSSFHNKRNYKIYLYDRSSKPEEIKKIIRKRKLKINFEILEDFPSGLNFFCAIICTHSIDRFEVVNKLIKKNKINFFILEKFLFIKKNQYKKIKKIFNINKIFVNVWSNIIYKILNLKKITNKKYVIKIFLPEGALLTNLIHYFYLFYILTKDKSPKIIKKKLKVIKSKRKSSDEITGQIRFISKNKEMNIKTSKNINNYHKIIIKTHKNYNIKIAIPNILLPSKKIPFPTCKKITFLNIKNFSNKKFNSNYKLPKFKDLEAVSLKILNNFRIVDKKKLIIN